MIRPLFPTSKENIEVRTARSRRSAAALLIVLAAAPANAQDPAFVLGVAGGASFDDDLTPGLTLNTALEAGFLAATHAEWYPGRGSTGLRFVASFARRELREGTGEYSVATGEIGAVLRAGARPSLGRVSPFVAVTGGAAMYSAADGSPAFAAGAFGDDPVVRFHLSPSVGLDRAISRRIGLRIEGGDRVVFPAIGESPPTIGTPITHIPFLLLGLHLRVGAGPDRPVVARRDPEERPPLAAEPPDTLGTPVDRPARVEPVPPTPEPAPPEPVVEPTPAPPPDEAERTIYTVQVGDFIEAATADRWSERLREWDIPTWRIDREIQGMAVARLRVGAATDEAVARAVAELIEREFGWAVSVRPVEPGEPVPPDAIERTRSVLDRM
jgi:cell division septation protein DedD